MQKIANNILLAFQVSAVLVSHPSIYTLKVPFSFHELLYLLFTWLYIREDGCEVGQGKNCVPRILLERGNFPGVSEPDSLPLLFGLCWDVLFPVRTSSSLLLSDSLFPWGC